MIAEDFCTSGSITSQVIRGEIAAGNGASRSAPFVTSGIIYQWTCRSRASVDITNCHSIAQDLIRDVLQRDALKYHPAEIDYGQSQNEVERDRNRALDHDRTQLTASPPAPTLLRPNFMRTKSPRQ